MGTLLLAALVFLLQHFLDSFTTLLTQWMAALQNMGLQEAHSAFVTATMRTMETIAFELLVLYLVFVGVKEYMLWSEGAPDTDGSSVWKGAAAASLGIAASSAITIGVFRFGMDLAGTMAGIHAAADGLTLTRAFVGVLAAHFSDMSLLIILGVYAISVVVLLLVVMQAAIRAAELAFYAAIAPLFALGLVRRDMGVFAGFRDKLLALSLSPFVVIFAIKAGNAAIANMGHSFASLATAPLVYLGFLWVALKGPHMLEGMIHHSGVGSTLIMPVAKNVIGQIGTGAGSSPATGAAATGGKGQA